MNLRGKRLSDKQTGGVQRITRSPYIEDISEASGDDHENGICGIPSHWHEEGYALCRRLSLEMVRLGACFMLFLKFAGLLFHMQ